MDVGSSTASPSRKLKRARQKSPKIIQTVVSEEDSTVDLIIAEDLILQSTTLKTKPALLTSKPAMASAVNNKKRKKRDSATSSDEERWLTAIESGKLEDVDDELKKIKPKDPALMTARQRAMYDRSSDGSSSVAAPTLMSLPTGYKEKVMTAEAIQKAAIKSQKRKQLADEKREKDKKKTMDRLLKKQESKASKFAKPKPTRSIVPSIIYTQNAKITMMSFQEGVEFPMQPQRIRAPPPPKYCRMGCGNLKKYSCSRTGAPLCSLQCYKKNIASRIL